MHGRRPSSAAKRPSMSSTRCSRRIAHIDQHRVSPVWRNDIRGGREGVGRGDHFVARAEVQATSARCIAAVAEFTAFTNFAPCSAEFFPRAFTWLAVVSQPLRRTDSTAKCTLIELHFAKGMRCSTTTRRSHKGRRNKAGGAIGISSVSEGGASVSRGTTSLPVPSGQGGAVASPPPLPAWFRPSSASAPPKPLRLCASAFRFFPQATTPTTNRQYD